MHARLITLAAGLILAFGPFPASAQDRADPSAAQWQEDLGVLATELRTRHPNPFHAVSEAAFTAAVADLDARIPHLKRNEMIVGMMRIAAMIGDGHTRVDPRKDPAFQFPSIPLKLYLFEDGLFVRATRPEQRGLLGAKVIAIGGVPVDEALRRAGELVSADTPMGRKLLAPLYLAMPDVLQPLGLADSTAAARLTIEQGGSVRTVTVAAGEVDPPWPPDTDISLVTPDGWLDARTTPAPPTFLAAPLEVHRMVEMPGRSAVYAQLNMVADTDDETLGAFGRRIREAVERTHARRLVFDLRLNQGGNGTLRNGLVAELVRADDDDTELFVLTGRGTFSASQFILDDLDRLTDARFVGEAASSRPTSYGDAYRIKLPNSGIALRTSLLYWQSEQNMDPWTWVEVGAPMTFADYVAGRDPALEAALSYQPPAPAGERFAAAFAADEAQGVERAVAAYLADPVHRYADNGIALADAAEGTFDKDRPTALAIARSAADMQPNVLVAQLEMAYLADKSGDRAQASASANRALQIDPRNRLARQILEGNS